MMKSEEDALSSVAHSLTKIVALLETLVKGRRCDDCGMLSEPTQMHAYLPSHNPRAPRLLCEICFNRRVIRE